MEGCPRVGEGARPDVEGRAPTEAEGTLRDLGRFPSGGGRDFLQKGEVPLPRGGILLDSGW